MISPDAVKLLRFLSLGVFLVFAQMARGSSFDSASLSACQNSMRALVSDQMSLAAKVRESYPSYHPPANEWGVDARVHQALNSLLGSYAQKGKALPAVIVDDSLEASEAAFKFSEQWALAKQQEPGWPEFTRVPTRPVGDLRSAKKYFFAKINGKDFMFRRLLDDDDLGLAKRFAADRLNALLGIDSSSQSFFAVVNGEKGLLSSFVPNAFPVAEEDEDLLLAHYNDAGAGLVSHFLPDLVAQNQLNENSLSDAYAYSFLINNHDLERRNFAVDEHGFLRIFDNDCSWGLQLPILDDFLIESRGLGPYPLGPVLPERYTSRFAAALRRLEPRMLVSELSPYLSSDQIEAFLFRREIILKDIELRGFAALFH